MLDDLELYLAASSLKSRNYSAATELYLKVNARNESAEAWLGMSFCKLYQLAEGLRIDEVISCFKRQNWLIQPFRLASKMRLLKDVKLLKLLM